VTASYVELHCHSNFSFLDGASHPEDLARQAARLGYGACALTDHSGLYGAVRFNQAAAEAGIKPIFGAEIVTTDEHHLVLLVANDTGYAHLCQLLSAAQLAGPKGCARVSPELLCNHTAGLIALSGCEQGEIPVLLKAGETTAAKRAAARYL
jgi:DNA polymerase III alpha subunit